MGAIGFNSSGQFQLGTTPVNWGKNYLINGNFDRWDYAASQTTSGYDSDNRWANFNGGSTKTHSRVVSTDIERAFFNSPYFSRTVVTSVAGVGNLVGKSERIENVTKLAGKTITLSFWAKADVTKNIAIEMRQNFGTGGTPSASISAISSQLVSLTSTWQKKSITITMPSIIGKTLGTDGVHTTFSELILWFDAGSDYNTLAANLGQQSGTFDIAEVQIEEGSVATSWSPYFGEFGGEVQACARYLPIINFTGGYHFTGHAMSTTLAQSSIPFKTESRIAPSGFTFDGTLSFSNATGSPVGTIVLSTASTSEVVLATSGVTTLVAGNASSIQGSATKILFTGCEL